MRIRTITLVAGLSAALLGGCGERDDGPLAVSAIGAAPRLLNPNLEPLDPPSAFLLEATAQGLLRFNAAGQVEPALAQSWIVSDDGLRYTFRLARLSWEGGAAVTAEQVAGRLRAAAGRASRNPVKPLLGAIDEIVAMTDTVLEISLKAPRPNFLQLLAQPEMAIVRRGKGAGPFRAAPFEDSIGLRLEPRDEDAEPEAADAPPHLRLRGERVGLAVARFAAGEARLVTGGTAGDLPVALAARGLAPSLVFDPVAGLFGLKFVHSRGLLADPGARRALAMAIDRDGLAAAIGAGELSRATAIVAAGVEELPAPASPDWASLTLAARRAEAAGIVAALPEELARSIRVAVPTGPGYRVIFAHLRRDWRAIGIEAESVASTATADLRLIDEVAPINLATWYLRHFTCAASPICAPEADVLLDAARLAPTAAERQALLAEADRAIGAAVPFIPLTTPVRWSLVAEGLTGFRPNAFARHPAAELVATAR